MVANILSGDPLPAPLTPTLGMGSIGRNSTFSEHGHVAYLNSQEKSEKLTTNNIL